MGNRYTGELAGLKAARADYDAMRDRSRIEKRQDRQARITDKANEREDVIFQQGQEDRNARIADIAENKKRIGLLNAREDFAYNEKRNAYELEKEKATLDPDKLAEENVFEFVDMLKRGKKDDAINAFNKKGKIKIADIKETADGYDLIDETGGATRITKKRAQAINEVGREYSIRQKNAQREEIKRIEDNVYKQGGSKFARQEDIPQGWVVSGMPDGTFLAYPDKMNRRNDNTPKNSRNRIDSLGRGNVGENLFRSFNDILKQKGYDVSTLNETVEQVDARQNKTTIPSKNAEDAVARMKSHLDRIISGNPDLTDDEIADELANVMGFPQSGGSNNGATGEQKSKNSLDKYF
jgi:hypothetical protein